jgi:biopolymer transport protein ExbD
MAEIAEGGGGGHGKHGKKRAKKESTRVDMTPMVDLAFLLLTFFVLTATMSKPKALSIAFPADNKDIEPKEVKNGVTFLLTKDNRVFYYTGQFYAAGNDKAKAPTVLTEISYAPKGGVRDLLKELNKEAFKQIADLDAEKIKTTMPDSTYKKRIGKINAKDEAVTVLIKTDDKAKYLDVVQMIDEMKILKITKFVNVDISQPEFDLLQAAAATPK